MQLLVDGVKDAANVVDGNQIDARLASSFLRMIVRMCIFGVIRLPTDC